MQPLACYIRQPPCLAATQVRHTASVAARQVGEAAGGPACRQHAHAVLKQSVGQLAARSRRAASGGNAKPAHR